MSSDKTHIPMFDARRTAKSLCGSLEKAASEVIRDGWYILGHKMTTFETDFCNVLCYANSIGVGSGTDALKIALMAAEAKMGGKIVLPANTAIPTAMAVIDAGFIPKFSDVSPETLLMDTHSLTEAIDDQTCAVIPVHLFGRPADMESLLSITRDRNLVVIEDCAQAHGAIINGTSVGSFGDAGAFSFYPSKNLGGLGDGGMIVTKHDSIAEKARQIRNYGQKDRYVTEMVGVNSRLDEVQAALLSAKLEYLEDWNHRRREIASMYTQQLSGLDVVLPEITEGHVFHLYVIRTTARDRLRKHLADENIASEIHYPVPLHLQKALEKFGAGKGSLPVAEKAANEILSIPLFPEMIDQEVERVAASILGFFGKS